MVLVDHLPDGDLRPDLRPVEDGRQIEAAGFPVVDRLVDIEEVERPIISSIVRKPRLAMCSRTCAAKWKKVSTNSGLPSNLARSFGSWVRCRRGTYWWQTRILMQPMTTAAPSREAVFLGARRAAMTTSRPVFSCPSVWTMISRSLF
jgi:hypothetical protein